MIELRNPYDKEHTEQIPHPKTTVEDSGRVGKAKSVPDARRRRFCILFSPEKSMACGGQTLRGQKIIPLKAAMDGGYNCPLESNVQR